MPILGRPEHRGRHSRRIERITVNPSHFFIRSSLSFACGYIAVSTWVIATDLTHSLLSSLAPCRRGKRSPRGLGTCLRRESRYHVYPSSVFCMYFSRMVYVLELLIWDPVRIIYYAMCHDSLASRFNLCVQVPIRSNSHI
jgi:hypothetical protein